MPVIVYESEKEAYKLILDFLISWNDWRVNGADWLNPYSRCRGLCCSLKDYLFCVQDEVALDKEFFNSLSCMFTQMFIDDGLNEWYPFGTREVFEEDFLNRTQHLNKRRIQWVEDKIIELHNNITTYQEES